MKKLIIPILLALFFTQNIFSQTYNDAALNRVISQDQESRQGGSAMETLPVGTHLYRAEVYMANRHFPEAREHWMKILDNYPTDPNVPKILFGIGRSFMWERNYEKAVFYFDKLFRDFTNTPEGRDGLNYKGASLVRWGKSKEAAEVYKQYTVMFPDGEKIDSAYLNIIDALRETGQYDEANLWVNKTIGRFRGTPTEVNALHARLRMEIYRQNWKEAVKAGDDLLEIGNFKGSMAWTDEVKYLKAFSLEKAGQTAEAKIIYLSIPDGPTSYYGGLATEKLENLGLKDLASTRSGTISPGLARTYPVMYRTTLLKFARAKNLDPRFLLAIMMQESSFRARAKSPAAARGLLQLVFDTALKYNRTSGYPNLEPDDLYDPTTNIAIGSSYIEDLKNEFGGMYEPIAVSYNGGEDNAARWLKRTNPKDKGVYAAEVGFNETKNYVFKVMSNYRVYRELYTENLVKK
ncbi:MAG: transglycosylase SLT domain-containing protein [Pyrinomonadaceae bacterium]